MKVEFYPAKSRDTKILAFGNVTVAEGIVVRGFRIVDGAKGVFAAVPSRPITVNGEARFVNQVAFESAEIRERFLAELLDDYHRWRKSAVERISPRGVEDSAVGDAVEDPPF